MATVCPSCPTLREDIAVTWPWSDDGDKFNVESYVRSPRTNVTEDQKRMGEMLQTLSPHWIPNWRGTPGVQGQN